MSIVKGCENKSQIIYFAGRREVKAAFFYRTRVMSLRILSRFMCRPSRFGQKRTESERGPGRARARAAGDRATPIYATPEFFEMGGREAPPPIEVHRSRRPSDQRDTILKSGF